MDVEKARLSELDAILELYQLAIADMRRKGIDQWDDIYPSREIIENDILRGEMLLLRIDHEIAAVVVWNDHQENEYPDAKWECDGPKIAVIHRLCVKPAYQGRGLAKKLMERIETHLVDRHYNAIRLDAFSENPNAVALYQKLGYREAGEITFRKGRFLLFEKVLHDDI